jgi:hypothetical protein
VVSAEVKGSYHIAQSLAGVEAVDLWIGAISFEPRCLASLRQCERSGIAVRRLIAFDYTSSVLQASEDLARRRAHRAELQAFAHTWAADGPHYLQLQPYELRDAQIALRGTDLLAVQNVVIDVSCMTKLHTIALAESFAAFASGAGRAYVVYARPENYGTMTDGFGWRETLVAPLTDRVPARRDPSDARGIVIPGHEGDRLRAALSALPSERGLIMVGDVPERRDFRERSERRNGQTMFLLTDLHAGQWTKVGVDTRDLPRVAEFTQGQIAAADAERRAIALYPFGPKPLVFEVARVLANRCPDATWLVYPMPHRYDIAYSAGDGVVTWYG